METKESVSWMSFRGYKEKKLGRTHPNSLLTWSDDLEMKSYLLRFAFALWKIRNVISCWEGYVRQASEKGKL